MKSDVKSTDPRKRAIVEALKRISGANKITLVKDNGDGTFSGNCLKGDRKGYEQLGVYTIQVSDIF